jgi:hypothetical protein
LDNTGWTKKFQGYPMHHHVIYKYENIDETSEGEIMLFSERGNGKLELVHMRYQVTVYQIPIGNYYPIFLIFTHPLRSYYYQ